MEKNCLPWNRSIVPKRMGTGAPKPSVRCRQTLKSWGSASPHTCSLSIHVQLQEPSLWASLPSPYPGLWVALQMGARESSWGHLCVCLESWRDCRSGWAGVESLCLSSCPSQGPEAPTPRLAPCVPGWAGQASLLGTRVCHDNIKDLGDSVWTELISITIANVLKLWRAHCHVLHIYVSNTEFNS